MLERGIRLRRNGFLIAALCAMILWVAAAAEPISVRHIQRPMHRFMVARSEDGKTIARGELSQVVQDDEVTMRPMDRLMMRRRRTRSRVRSG